MIATRGPTDEELGRACGRLFDRLETALSLLSMPPDVQCGIARRFDGAASRSPAAAARLRVAVPKLDSAVNPIAAGQRAAVAPATRQLVFATESADVAISMRRHNGGCELDLNGQVFPSTEIDDWHYSAVLLRGMDEAASATTDELGEFAFEAIPPGQYHMLLGHNATDLMIIPLQVGV